MKISARKLISILLFVISLTMVLIVTQPSQAETIKLSYATSLPPTHPLSKVDKLWIENIEKKTDGRVKITMFTGNSLVTPLKAWTELNKGVCDIARVICGYQLAQFPIIEYLPLFVYGADYSTLRKIWPLMWEKFPELRAEYEGAKILVFEGGNNYYLNTKKPVNSLADVDGLKLKASAGLAKIFGALGAEIINMPTGEVYMALEKNIIDGHVFPAELLKSLKLAEVSKYHINTYLPIPIGSIVRAVNQETWNKLPVDVQKVFTDSIDSWRTEIDNVILNSEKAGIDFAEKSGSKFSEFSETDKEKYFDVIRKLADEGAEKLESKGIPGREIFRETQALIKQYSK